MLLLLPDVDDLNLYKSLILRCLMTCFHVWLSLCMCILARCTFQQLPCHPNKQRASESDTLGFSLLTTSIT
jgi:hypothetical protein